MPSREGTSHPIHITNPSSTQHNGRCKWKDILRKQPCVCVFVCLMLCFCVSAGKHEPGTTMTVEDLFCPISGRFRFTYSANHGEFQCEQPYSELSNCPNGNGLNVRFRQCAFPDMSKDSSFIHSTVTDIKSFFKWVILTTKIYLRASGVFNKKINLKSQKYNEFKIYNSITHYTTKRKGNLNVSTISILKEPLK